MKKEQIKQYLLIGSICLLCVIGLTIYGPKIGGKKTAVMLSNSSASAILEQKVEQVNAQPQEIYRVYYKNQEIGKMHDVELMKPLLQKVYTQRYAEEFPDSKLNLGEDIHISKETTYYSYENIDDKILDYIANHDYFAVEVTKIIFSNGNEAYVKNLDDFTVAKDRYVLMFISKDAYTNIQNKINQPLLTNYGYQETSIKIKEDIEISRGFAPISKILKNVDEIVYYLSYGYDTVPEYYTVQKYDTIEGIAQVHRLEADHLVMINKELKSPDQILKVGSQLNVTYYNSPITITVTREVLRKEPHYPSSTKYIKDPTLNEGVQKTVTKEKVGSDDVRVMETWVNGVLQGNEIVGREVKIAPIQEVVRIGTKVVPGTGTGTFRWPVDYPTITCRWYCYAGHKAIDLQNRYNRYGNIYAADRGTIVENSYNSTNGYFVKINHNNGLLTYYGHMRSKSPLAKGTKVEKGQIIGNIGQTGVATGPHVHFAIERNGVRINPCLYLGC